MKTYLCRLIKPQLSNWAKIEAETADDAAVELHFQFMSPFFDNNSYTLDITPDIREKYCTYNSPSDGIETVHLALVEVSTDGESGEKIISRNFSSKIYRKSNKQQDLANFQKELERIATNLDWKRDPLELIAEW